MQQFSGHRSFPRVVVTVEDDGTVASTLDGELFIAGPLGRELVGHLVDCIAEQHGGPIRLEIREGGRLMHMQDLMGDGFLPGEGVAIALVLGERRAATDGHLHAVLETIPRPYDAGDLILFGTRSGTLVRGGTP